MHLTLAHLVGHKWSVSHKHNHNHAFTQTYTRIQPYNHRHLQALIHSHNLKPTKKTVTQFYSPPWHTKSLPYSHSLPKPISTNVSHNHNHIPTWGTHIITSTPAHPTPTSHNWTLTLRHSNTHTGKERQVTLTNTAPHAVTVSQTHSKGHKRDTHALSPYCHSHTAEHNTTRGYNTVEPKPYAHPGDMEL